MWFDFTTNGARETHSPTYQVRMAMSEASSPRAGSICLHPPPDARESGHDDGKGVLARGMTALARTQEDASKSWVDGCQSFHANQKE